MDALEASQLIATPLTLADLPELGPWVIQKMRETWPTLSEPVCLSRLRGWLSSGEFHVVKCKRSVGVAHRVRHHVDAQIDVHEIRVWPSDRIESSNSLEWAEVRPIYQDFRAWATTLGARDVILCPDASELPPLLVKAEFGGIARRTVVIAP